MRISDFLKNTEEQQTRLASPQRHKLPPKAAEEKAPEVREKPSPEPSVAPTNRQEIEKNIRDQMEADFEKKLEMIRKTLDQSFHSKMEEFAKLLQEKDAALEAEKEKQQEMQGLLEKASLDIVESKESYKKTVEEKYEKEKERIFKLFEGQLASAKETIDRLEKAVQDKEKELQVSQKQDNQVTKSESEPAEKPKEIKGIAPEVQAEKPHPVQVPAQVVEKMDAAENVTARGLDDHPFVLDAKVEEQVRKQRDLLTHEITRIFDLVRSGQDIDLAFLKRRIVETFRDLKENEALWLKTVLEDYTLDKQFVCHGVNVAILSGLMGMELNFEQANLEDLFLAAALHDIGLVEISEDLNYPKQLTPHLQKKVVEHPEKGAKMLSNLVSENVAEGIFQHHEVATGKGYPRGLMEEDIHIFASIIHVADSFEALIHERPYRAKPLPVHEAIKQLVDVGRNVYNRKVLKSLMVRVGLYPVMTYVELSNKHVAQVIRQDRTHPLSPTVQIEFDEFGVRLPKPRVLNLAQSQFVHILGPAQSDQERPASSHFASVESSHHRKFSASTFLQNVIPLLLVLIVFAILLYVVIKI